LHRVLKRSAAAALLVLTGSLVFAIPHWPGASFDRVNAQTAPTETPTASCTADAGGAGCGAGGPTSTPAPGGGSAGDCSWEEGDSSGVWIYGGTAPPQSSWPWLTTAEYESVATWMNSHAPVGLGTPPYTAMGVVFCPDPTVAGVFAIGTLPTPPTVDSVLGLWALSFVAWNPPSIATSPPLNTAAVVNLPTYLYLNPGAWQNFTATASAAGVTATVVATPAEVVWSTGDGNTVTCAPPQAPGVPYNSSWGSTPPPASAGACTYAYRYPDQPGAYQLSATVWYDAVWTSTGAGGAGGDLGLVPGPTASVSLQLDQIRSIVTG